MTRHDQEIDELKQKLLTMAGHAEKAVLDAVKSVVERNSELAKAVKAADNTIDRLEVEIDDKAVYLLSKAPLAGDLRFITVAMKISQNLERVGDEATTIARRSLELNIEPDLQGCIDVPRITDLALAMLRDALDAFVRQDASKAEAIVPRDQDVDRLHKQFLRVLSSYMIEDPGTISRCLNLMTISKSIERIADHATNIAEEVVYLCQARDIRHSGGASST